MNITLIPRITGGLLSGPAAKWLGSTALLLTLLTSSASAEEQISHSELPAIDVTDFEVTETGGNGFTVYSGNTSYTVSNNATVENPNPVKLKYGATRNDNSNDDSYAFQTALDILNAATGGYLYIPVGEYSFNKQVVVHDKHEIGNSIAIRGGVGGQGARILCNNTDGILLLKHDDRNPRVTISDLYLIPRKEGSGTALEVQIAAGVATPDNRVVTAENITMYPAGTTNYFNKGIVIAGIDGGVGCYRSIIKNCTFIAPYSGGLTEADFKAKSGFDMSDCYSPTLDHCTVEGAKNGFEMKSTRHVEDSAFLGCVVKNCYRGINIWWTTPEVVTGTHTPTNWIRDCDITASYRGVVLASRKLVQIVNNKIRPMKAELMINEEFVDVELSNVILGIVEKNTFVHITNTGTHTNIQVNDPYCEDLILDNPNNTQEPIYTGTNATRDIIAY